MVLPPQDFGGGNNKARRRKQSQLTSNTTASARGEDPERMPFREALAAFHSKAGRDDCELSPCHSPIKSLYGSASEPLAQRRRIYTSGDNWNMGEAEADMIIEAEMLAGDIMRLSDGEELPINAEMLEAFKDVNFSVNDSDGLGPSRRGPGIEHGYHDAHKSLGDEFVMQHFRHAQHTEEPRISGFSQLDHNSLRGMRRGSDEGHLPKQVKSTDEYRLSEIEMRLSGMSEFLNSPQSKPATLRSGGEKEHETHQSRIPDVNPALRYNSQNSLDGWLGDMGGTQMGIAVSHNEEPPSRSRSNEPLSRSGPNSKGSGPNSKGSGPNSKGSGSDASLTPSVGDAFLTELLGEDLKRVSGNHSGRWE